MRSRIVMAVGQSTLIGILSYQVHPFARRPSPVARVLELYKQQDLWISIFVIL